MQTERMFELYRTMSVEELADRLEDLDEQRTPVGWTPQTAAHRQSIEQRLVAVVAGAVPVRGALKIELDVKVRSKVLVSPGVADELAAGSIAVRTAPVWMPGSTVDIEVLEAGAAERGLRIRGVVQASHGDRTRFAISWGDSEGQERRLRRFVREAMRHRVPRAS